MAECCSCCTPRTVAIVFTILWAVQAVWGAWNGVKGLEIIGDIDNPNANSLRAMLTALMVAEVIQVVLCSLVLLGIWKRKPTLLLPMIVWRLVWCIIVVGTGIKLYSFGTVNTEVTRDIIVSIVTSFIGCFYIYIHHGELTSNPELYQFGDTRANYEAI
eukprot:GFUD01029307.1.p1 GENE.GFUD01029307.1~~GFUD01029307.1.p1  ORF type:complete len:159 (-),score=29.57 GFUD01029307.1:235-711(-)